MTYRLNILRSYYLEQYLENPPCLYWKTIVRSRS